MVASRWSRPLAWESDTFTVSSTIVPVFSLTICDLRLMSESLAAARLRWSMLILSGARMSLMRLSAPATAEISNGGRAAWRALTLNLRVAIIESTCADTLVILAIIGSRPMGEKMRAARSRLWRSIVVALSRVRKWRLTSEMEILPTSRVITRSGSCRSTFIFLPSLEIWAFALALRLSVAGNSENLSAWRSMLLPSTSAVQL